MYQLPLVSVVIPNFNSASFLDETIKSVLASTYPSLEIIVVDDGSTDDSALSLARWQNLFPEKIRTLYQCNQGPSIARNNGIYQAKGTYILALDSDDKIHENYISEAVEKFERNPELKLVYCEAEKFGAKNEHWKLPSFSLEALALDNMIFVSALFKKSDWEKVGGFDPRFNWGWEDWEFWIHLLKSGGQVEKIPAVRFYYRIRKGSRRKSTNQEGKKMTIQLLNSKHPEFFNSYLKGPLRNPRGISKFVNPILSFLNPIAGKSLKVQELLLVNKN